MKSPQQDGTLDLSFKEIKSGARALKGSLGEPVKSVYAA